jgi:hypothetical protein
VKRGTSPAAQSFNVLAGAEYRLDSGLMQAARKVLGRQARIEVDRRFAGHEHGQVRRRTPDSGRQQDTHRLLGQVLELAGNVQSGNKKLFAGGLGSAGIGHGKPGRSAFDCAQPPFREGGLGACKLLPGQDGLTVHGVLDFLWCG